MALLTHLLACVFGTGSWVTINGLWVELPLLGMVLPEKWDLPSYITIIIQTANVGPLFVTLMHRFRPGLLKEVAVIYVIVSMGIVASLLLAFLWNYTSSIAGQLHSTAFLILTFFLALVDCTSSVTFLPFMMQLQPQYLTTFFIGEGLSGLIPALIALGQGSGISSCTNVSRVVNATIGNETVETTVFQLETRYFPANFSTLLFFLLMTVMMVACLLAFFFLARQPKVWELSQQQLFPSDVMLSSFEQIPEKGADSHLSGGYLCPKDAKRPRDILPEVSYSVAKSTFIYLVIAWVSTLMNGVLPSVQSYSCLPYGNTAYHLTATLSSMANPLACIVAMVLPSRWVARRRGALGTAPRCATRATGRRRRVGEGPRGAGGLAAGTPRERSTEPARSRSACAAGLCPSLGTGWQRSPVSLGCPSQVPGPAGRPHRGGDGLWCLQHGHRRDESLPAPPAVPVGRCHHRKSQRPSRPVRSPGPPPAPASPQSPPSPRWGAPPTPLIALPPRSTRSSPGCSSPGRSPT